MDIVAWSRPLTYDLDVFLDLDIFPYQLCALPETSFFSLAIVYVWNRYYASPVHGRYSSRLLGPQRTRSKHERSALAASGCRYLHQLRFRWKKNWSIPELVPVTFYKLFQPVIALSSQLSLFYLCCLIHVHQEKSKSTTLMLYFRRKNTYYRIVLDLYSRVYYWCSTLCIAKDDGSAILHRFEEVIQVQYFVSEILP